MDSHVLVRSHAADSVHQETSEILPLSTVFLQPVELMTTCTLTMLGALEVVRAAYCAL